MKLYYFPMRGIKFCLICIIAFISCQSLHAQQSNCKNLSFELGDFTNWEGYNWFYSSVPQNASLNTAPVKVTLPTLRRQVIMTDTTAFDANTGNALRKIPRGYRYSARLGDEIISGVDKMPRDWEQSLRYTMTIDSTNALLILKFALVLQYAGHRDIEEPRFKLTLFDQFGEPIPDCANYDVFASNNNVEGFQSYSKQGTNIKWRDWTTVGTNLLKYVGQTITVEFMAADCTQLFHYGYAYFVAECHPLFITVKYCNGDSIATLKAPEGFETYNWTDSRGKGVGASRIYSIENPVEGETYSCTMTSFTGCTVVLQSIIARYELKTDFSSSMIDCKSNKVQLNNLSSTNRGTLDYKWDFGDGKELSEREPQFTFATSGRHQVSLIVRNPPSGCVDTLTKTIESFSPPLVGLTGETTYCPGKGTYLKAYGAWTYSWSNGLTADSIEAKAPGGEYWLLGRSSNGCVSDTIYRTVNEEPDWLFSDLSDTTLCVGESSILKVSGAVRYLWDSKETTDSIKVSMPGIYKVTGFNARGCEKIKDIQVKEYQFPEVKFKTSPSVLDERHNLLILEIPLQSGTLYSWDMGDGSTESGAMTQHQYNIGNTVREYTITLTATSQYDCVNHSSAIVDVIPFVPNVFSPNGDGINDVFMPDLEVQIFDRNGILLFKGTSGWDGTYNGKLMEPDTYFYILHYLDRKQMDHTSKGFLTLIH